MICNDESETLSCGFTSLLHNPHDPLVPHRRRAQIEPIAPPNPQNINRGLCLSDFPGPLHTMISLPIISI